MVDKAKKKEKLHIFSSGRSDITLIFVVLFLIAFGIIMIYSSSYYYAYEKFGDHGHFIIRQLRWAILGTVLMLIVSRINYKLLTKLSFLLYLVSGVLLVVVLMMPAIKDTKRWLVIGGVNFQPSEVAKIALILFLPFLIDAFAKYINRTKVLLLLFFIAAVPIALTAVANLSTALIMVAIVGVMFFIVYKSVFKLILFALPVLGGTGYLFLKKVGYRSARIKIWLEGPFSDPLGDGFQTIQSLYAIGAGGFFGVGLGRGIQKIDFLPEAQNDIIFAIICEELGLFGALCILLLFALLIWRLFDIIRNCDEVMPMVIIAGVMTHISVQTFINISVVTNTLPATGVPLPFISYGGTSLIFLMVEIGLVLNIARQNNKRMEVSE